MSSTKESVAASLESVIIDGDLASLSPTDRVIYYKAMCDRLGLDPLSRPFDYIKKKEKGTFKEKVFLYARREATEQLRKLHEISIKISSREMVGDVYVVTAQATNSGGRCDESIGAVDLSNVAGESRANAMMSCETKAKRRVTLSICGLGMLDESEISSILGAKQEKIDFATGEIIPKKIPQLASHCQVQRIQELVEASNYSEEKILKQLHKVGAKTFLDLSEDHAQKMIDWLTPKYGEIQHDDHLNHGSRVA